MEALSFSFFSSCWGGGTGVVTEVILLFIWENSIAVPEVIYICLFPGVSKRERDRGEEGGT